MSRAKASPSNTAGAESRYITVEVKVKLQAIALSEADGGYSVVVPALPGCFTQGDTLEEVQANIVEAAEGWLAATHDQNKASAIAGMTE